MRPSAFLARRLTHVARFALLLTLAPVPVRSQSRVIDGRFWIVDGTVSDIQATPGAVYLGGSFTKLRPWTGACVGVDPTTGAIVTHWPHFNGAVLAIASDNAGGFYLGGDFTKINGVTRNFVAHLRADLTLDDWNPNSNGEIRTIVPVGSRIYVGGSFTVIGGQSRSHIAALDATSGAAAAWNPNATGSFSTVAAIAVDGATVYAGGQFQTIGGFFRNNVAALDATTGAATSFNPGWSGPVNALAVANGIAYVGGSIGVQAYDVTTSVRTSWDPMVGPTFVLKVAGSRLYAGGDLGSAFGQPRGSVASFDLATGNLTPWNPVLDGSCRSIDVSGTTVYLGGLFTHAAGQPRAHLAAVDATTGAALAWDPSSDNGAYAIASNGARVCVGGIFSGVGGVPRANLAALDPATGAPTSWNPGADNGVSALAINGSTVYAGGLFTHVGGLARNFLAAINAGSGAVAGWDPSPDAFVSKLAVGGGAVVAAGAFEHVGAQSRHRLAAIDPASGSPTWDAAQDGQVNSLEASGGQIYVGGFFFNIGGQARINLAALDLATGQATGFTVNGVYAPVLAIRRAGTTLYVGGEFSAIDGQNRRGVGALDATSGSLLAWDPGLTSGRVFEIEMDGSNVYLGGDFFGVGGQPGQSFAAVDAATASPSFLPALSSVFVPAIALQAGELYVGGTFGSIAGQPRQGFAAFRDASAIGPVSHVASPNGGEILQPGNVQSLTWSATDDFGVESVDLYLSRTGPAGPWELLAAGAPNTGSYAWTVAGGGANGNAYLRVDARDDEGHVDSDLSDAGFSINAPILGIGPASDRVLTLAPVHPNPVITRSSISFELPRRTPARLSLIDVQGREVAVLASGVFEAGRHAATIEAHGLRAGVYFATLTIPGAARTQRLAIVH